MMFNWVDAAIIVTFIIYIIEGLNRGLVEQLLELLGFFITVFLAAWTYRPLGTWLGHHFGLTSQAAEPLAFLIDWVVLQGLYSLALRFFYRMMPSFVRRSRANHVAGVIPAFLKAYIIIAVILTVTDIATVPLQLKTDINQSYLGSRFVGQSAIVGNYLNKIFGENVEQSLTFLTVPPQNEQIISSNERVALGFTTTDVTVDAKAESQMLQLVNQARNQAGLAPLTMNQPLTSLAEAHSRDMFAKGYFSHTDLNGQSPFDRMTTAGISYQEAGENIAYAANVELAFDGLMNSPEHRANILDKDYHKVGMGIINGGIYGEMFTQDFTN